MTQLRPKWETKGLGSVVGSNICQRERLSHIMFADDTTLVAKSRQALASMIKDLKEALEQVGLKLNDQKCKIQCNAARPFGSTSLKFGGLNIPIVAPDLGFKVLGTQFTLLGHGAAEFHNRIQAAWGKYHQIWPLLRMRDTSLSKRLRLFDCTVSATH